MKLDNINVAKLLSGKLSHSQKLPATATRKPSAPPTAASSNKMHLTTFHYVAKCSHMQINRYLKNQIINDLKEKMVFLGGPRQVGKTTLSKELIRGKDQYLNWDLLPDRKLISSGELSSELGLVVFDEIHKFKNWRSLVKGYHDKYFPELRILVTGSARLDYFRKGGDSLVGRYHYLRLHPLTLNEINKKPTAADLQNLIQYGGFPEPFFKQSQIFHNRWQLERISRVVTQDLRDLETVKEISLVELLANALTTRVGSPLSIKGLSEDLQVSPHTIDRWIQILDNLYYSFRISPYGPERMKAVKKAQKIYMWDWSQVEDKGARFENLVASQLLKFCHFQEDTLGIKTELRYFRSSVTEKEIDFIILQKAKPLFAVECKTGDKQISKSLFLDGKNLKIPKLYQVHMGHKDYGTAESVRVLPFTKFCEIEGMP